MSDLDQKTPNMSEISDVLHPTNYAPSRTIKHLESKSEISDLLCLDKQYKTKSTNKSEIFNMVHREPSWKSKTKMSREFCDTIPLYKLRGKREWRAIHKQASS